MKIELKVGGKKYSGWENITITKSMQSVAHNFSMNIYKGDNLSILDDDLIEILKDDKVFFTGYLDRIVLGISDVKKPLFLEGRSKALDLIDCNILNNKQYNKQTIKQIISDLVDPFGIKVSSSLELDTIDVFDTKIGETYFNAINRLCKQTNTLPISDNEGNIEITKNVGNQESKILKDQDFKELTYPKRLINRFDKYTYKKDGIKSDITDGTVEDSTVKRFRPFVAINTEDKTNNDLAKWKKNNNKSNEICLRAVVYGWDFSINTIVKVETDVVNASFLIKDITYLKGDNGTVSDMTLVSKDLYE